MDSSSAIIACFTESALPEEFERLCAELPVRCVRLGGESTGRGEFDPAEVALLVFDLRESRQRWLARAKSLRAMSLFREAPFLFLLSSAEEFAAITEIDYCDAIVAPIEEVQLRQRVRFALASHERKRESRSGDLTKRIEKNERENLLNLFRQTPEFVATVRGPDHVFELVNESHVKALGFDATGMTVREAQPESAELHGIIDHVYKTGETVYLHERDVMIGGRKRYFNLTYSARRAENGEIDGIMALGSEVTDSVVAREKLRESERLLEEIIETIPHGIWRTNPDGAADYCSARFSEMVGLPQEELLGWGWVELIHPEDQPSVIAEWQRCREARGPVRVEFRARVGDEYRWFISLGNPFFDEHGELTKYFGTWTDVHEARTMRASLMASESALGKTLQESRFLFEISPVFIAFSDPRTARLIAVNDLALASIRRRRDEVLGSVMWETPWWTAFPSSVARLREMFNRASQGESSQADLAYWAAGESGQGETRWTEIRVVPLIDENGAVMRVAMAGTDITQRVNAAEAMQAAKAEAEHARDEAERANTLKSAFLANMSHEIRTPLGAMIGFTDLLRDPDIDRDERANYLDILSRNAESLAVIINDILDLSKVEAGHLMLEYTEFDPERVLTDVVSLLKIKAKQKNLELNFELRDTLPHHFVSDPVRVKQVLLNLVGNSVKFTHKGKIQICAFGCITESGRKAACFEISDTGIGIAPAERARIFEMFVQADGSMTRRFGGTGLGLALSRSLARALGGDVTIVHSEEGRGTTFLFKVEEREERVERVDAPPSALRQTLPARKKMDQKQRLKDLSVLIVDDAPDNQQLISRYLIKQGARTETANDGREGYEKALAGTYDVVLMDIQMPLMDGYTATAKLRQAGFRAPIIALTAHAMGEVRRKCLEAGCNEQMTKPLQPVELIATIARLVEAPEYSTL